MPRRKSTVDGESHLSSEPKVYKALRDFPAQVGATYVYFKAGDLINDFHLISNLLAHNCPIVPEEDATTVVCPNCKHVFPFLVSTEN